MIPNEDGASLPSSRSAIVRSIVVEILPATWRDAFRNSQRMPGFCIPRL